MKIDSANKAFTERKISLTNPGAPWFEYCPDTVEAVKEAFLAIVSDQPQANHKLRMVAVNAVIKRDNLPIALVSDSTTAKEWVDTYWELYQRNYILLGYNKNKAMGCQIFSIKESDRKKLKMH